MVQFLVLVHLEGTGLGQGNVDFHGCQTKSRKQLTLLPSATWEHPMKLRSVVSNLLYMASANTVRGDTHERSMSFLGFDQTSCFKVMLCAGWYFAAVVVVVVGVGGCEYFSHCSQTGSALPEVCMCERKCSALLN